MSLRKSLRSDMEEAAVEKMSKFDLPKLAVTMDMSKQNLPIKNMADLNLQAHINGSYRPEGDPMCTHRDAESGKSTVAYNDSTMGGIGSTWSKMCETCGKVWCDD